MNIPEGFASVTPYFVVDDAAGFVRFLIDGLGGEEVLRSMRKDLIGNAQILINGSTVMVTDAVAACPAMCACYYLYVDNADVAMERAIAHGAVLEMEVMDMCYGDRQGGVRDAWGNIWWISQRLTAEPYSS